jgi:hypothetical protein
MTVRCYCIMDWSQIMKAMVITGNNVVNGVSSGLLA